MIAPVNHRGAVAPKSDLRQAAEDLREFSRILAQNPSVLVRGRNDAE